MANSKYKKTNEMKLGSVAEVCGREYKLVQVWNGSCFVFYNVFYRIKQLLNICSLLVNPGATLFL